MEMTTTTHSNGANKSTTNTALAVRPQQATPSIAPASWEPENLDAGIHFAQLICKGQLMPRALQGNPANVLLVLMTGRELGLSPMQAIRSIHVIDGKGVASADILVALCKRRRDVCQFFRMVESTDTRAVYETHRVGEPQPTKMTFTMEEAKAAGVAGKDNWKKWPAAMLRARCSAALARAVYPDLCAGIYDPDELGQPAGAPVSAAVTSTPAFTEAAGVETINDPPVDQPPAPETPAVQRMVNRGGEVEAAAEEAAPPPADGMTLVGDLAGDLARLQATTTPQDRMAVMKELVAKYPANTPDRARVNELYAQMQKQR